MNSHQLRKSRVDRARTLRLAKLEQDELSPDGVAITEKAILDHAIARRELELLNARLRAHPGCRTEHTNELLQIELLSASRPYALLGGVAILVGVVTALFVPNPWLSLYFAGVGIVMLAVAATRRRSRIRAVVAAGDAAVVALRWSCEFNMHDPSQREISIRSLWVEMGRVDGAVREEIPTVWERVRGTLRRGA